jgi:hypothetical protein
MVVDDISTHAGFLTFTRRHPEYQTIICPSEDRLGEFGIAVKTANALQHGVGRIRFLAARGGHVVGRQLLVGRCQQVAQVLASHPEIGRV